ncbi:DUF6907 domain-containing protein [Streptomyces sp. Tue6028]|uniref:DUF6907 domain-containing protein n=1 Tax=Streptomyces sp. Tue6028 TaxID=2036037 RepID=UPI003D73B584
MYVECPTWCSTDHVAENVRLLEDLSHSGEAADLAIPGGPGYRLLAHARLGLDPFTEDVSERQPYVLVDNQSEPFVLRPVEAEVFADRLEVFAARVRALARSAS